MSLASAHQQVATAFGHSNSPLKHSDHFSALWAKAFQHCVTPVSLCKYRPAEIIVFQRRQEDVRSGGSNWYLHHSVATDHILRFYCRFSQRALAGSNTNTICDWLNRRDEWFGSYQKVAIVKISQAIFIILTLPILPNHPCLEHLTGSHLALSHPVLNPD